MDGILVLVLIVLAIIVLYQKANKASGGFLGSVVFGGILAMVIVYLISEWDENHRPPKEPLGAVVGSILTDETYWDSSSIDAEECKWRTSMGLSCAVPYAPKYQAGFSVLSVDPGSPAWQAGLQVGDFVRQGENVILVDPETDKGTQRDKASDSARALARALDRSRVWVLRRPNEKGDSSLYVVRPVNLNAITHLELRIPANGIDGVINSLQESGQATDQLLEKIRRRHIAPLSQPPSYTAMPNPLADHGTSSAPKRTRDVLPTLPPLPDFRPMPDPLHGH